MAVDSKKKVCVTVPCYNEVGNVKPMADTLTKIMQELPYDYEILFTDNCSTDGTKEILRSLAAQDKHIKVLMNNRNYGTDRRASTGCGKYAEGDVFIAIACDFQEPPELIPEFLKYWEQGYKVVCGQKTSSKESRLKYACRCIFYKLINELSDTPQYENMSGILCFDKEVYEELKKYDYDVDFRFIVADAGYEVKLIQYQQQKRRSGKSSYNVWRYLTFAITSMIATSTAPLRLMTVAGFLMSVISFAAGLVYLIAKLLFWYHFQAGMAPILIGMFFIGSVQLFFLGIVGEYIGVILRRVSKTPEAILSEKLNVEEIPPDGE